MEATAKHDFNATADDELTFRKHQILKVKATISTFRPLDQDQGAYPKIIHWVVSYTNLVKKVHGT